MDQNGLIKNQIITPKLSDWRVRFFFVDGSSKTIRVSPGKISQEKAVATAKRSINLMDECVLDRIETTRADVKASAPFGIIKKG